MKLPIAAVKEIASGERPSNPAPNPLVRAFADNATPSMIASPSQYHRIYLHRQPQDYAEFL